MSGANTRPDEIRPILYGWLMDSTEITKRPNWSSTEYLRGKMRVKIEKLRIQIEALMRGDLKILNLSESLNLNVTLGNIRSILTDYDLMTLRMLRQEINRGEVNND